MIYRWQDYLIPRTLEEALDHLDGDSDRTRIIAGGTDLIVSLEKKDLFIPTVIDISSISELSGIRIEENRVRIGANVTLAEIQNHAGIQKHAPYLVTAVRSIGSIQIRNIATLAGNVGNASPAADGILPLLALNSVVTLVKKNGKREMPLKSFLAGPGRTAINPDEMISAITFSIPGSGFFGSFQKLGLRKAMNISIANAAIAVKVMDETVLDARIALGAVGPTAIRAMKAEEAVTGSKLTDQTIGKISDLCAESSFPIDDIRASAAYRQKMVRALVIRCMNDIREQVAYSEIHQTR